MKHLLPCAILLSLVMLGGCQLFGPEEKDLMFNPLFHKAYRYSVSITTSTLLNYLQGTAPEGSDKEILDTLMLDFTLRNIYYTDSTVVCKMVFNNLKKKKPKGRIVFINSRSHQFDTWKDPFSIYDSAGRYIHGLSVQVMFGKNGKVLQVAGVADLMEDIARAGNKSEREIRGWMRDYVGAFAITDLLNRIFSVLPEAPVKQDDRWVRNITLEAKAPVKISNLNTFKQRHGDTVYLNVESLVSAEQSEGGTVYMKGRQTGQSVVNYSSGMPFFYETTSRTVTEITSGKYDVIQKEHFVLQRLDMVGR